MIFPDSDQGGFKICIVATNNGLLIDPCPCTNNQISSKVHVSFLFGEVENLDFLEVGCFGNGCDKSLIRG